MKEKSKHWKARAAALTLLVAVAAPALAAGPADLAAVQVFGGGIDFAPQVPYESAILTVSGVGRTFTVEFDSLSHPTISAFDPEGQLLADGVYCWQLQLVPDAATAEELRASAAANGGRAARPWAAQFGSFAIHGGAFASPDLVEAGSRRPGEDRVGLRTRVAGDRAATGPDSDAMSASAVEAPSPRAPAGQISAQTGFDSDHAALERGASPEPALAAVPRAHEIERLHQPPRSDGSNGRPRSDR